MNPLFKKIPDVERREKFIKFRVNDAEKRLIENEARLRNLTVSTYLKRIALHRRADVAIESIMILELRSAVAAIKELHAAYLQNSLPPPESVLGPVISNAILAIQNMARY